MHKPSPLGRRKIPRESLPPREPAVDGGANQCTACNGLQGHVGPCMLHNPSYDFNDELLPLGATYWVKLVERYLARG